MLKKLALIYIVLLVSGFAAHAQFADCSTGLLQMPTSEMQEDGTFIIMNNFQNYTTFQYGSAMSFRRYNKQLKWK